MSDVVVVGSANADLVIDVDRHPDPGETLLGRGIGEGPGGKGLNQAVAAARAGARTAFCGAIGNDSSGALLRSTLIAEGIDLTGLREQPGPSGRAVVVVAESGENSIIVVPGANMFAAPDPQLVASAAVVVLQLEIPLVAVCMAAQLASGRVILNAAPSQPLPDELLVDVDVLVVNEHEARDLTGCEDIDAAVAHLAGQVETVVVTLGAAGCQVVSAGTSAMVEGRQAHAVVDTTGAGDTFVGYLAAGLAGGLDLVAAAERANVAGSLAVESPGAATSIPTIAAVEGTTD